MNKLSALEMLVRAEDYLFSNTIGGRFNIDWEAVRILRSLQIELRTEIACIIGAYNLPRNFYKVGGNNANR